MLMQSIPPTPHLLKPPIPPIPIPIPMPPMPIPIPIPVFIGFILPQTLQIISNSFRFNKQKTTSQSSLIINSDPSSYTIILQDHKSKSNKSSIISIIFLIIINFTLKRVTTMQIIEKAFLTVLLLRLSQLFIDYNYDRADEYWQGSQIAYKLHYGYGYLSWEWIMTEPIRSPLYQLYLSFGYSFCDHIQCSSYLKQIAPKIMQLFLSLLCDWFFLKTMFYYNKGISYLTCLCVLTNWYYFSMLNRIYINSAQTCIAFISFYFWVTREDNPKNDLISRILVAINFSLRPTSLFFWAVVWPYELLTKKSGHLLFIFKNAVQLIVICLISVVVGSWWYGKWVWIDYNFFKYNVFLKFSELYGINSFFEYFYLMVPMILGSYLIPLLISINKSLPSLKKIIKKPKQKGQQDQQGGAISTREEWQDKKYWELFILTISILLFLSISTHKQPRFLLIVLPLILLSCIRGFKKLEEYKVVLGIILIINLLLFTMINIGGKAGGASVLRELRRQIDQYPPQKHPQLTVMYLCEPHSLPLMTIIQRNIDFRLIDTSPFRKIKNFDEEHELRENPYELFQQMSRGQDPTFIIIQQKYATKGAHINEKYSFLLSKNYQIKGSYRNVNTLQQWFAGWDGWVLLKK